MIALLDKMLRHNALALLVQRLGLLNDAVPDEAAAIFAIFNILENMIEIKPEIADLLVADTEVALLTPAPVHGCTPTHPPSHPPTHQPT